MAGKKDKIIAELQELNVSHNPNDHWKTLEKLLESSKAEKEEEPAKQVEEAKPEEVKVEEKPISEEKQKVIDELNERKIPHDPNEKFSKLNNLLKDVIKAEEDEEKPEKILLQKAPSMKHKNIELQNAIVKAKGNAVKELEQMEAKFMKMHKQFKGFNNTLSRKAHTVSRTMKALKRHFKI